MPQVYRFLGTQRRVVHAAEECGHALATGTLPGDGSQQAPVFGRFSFPVR